MVCRPLHLVGLPEAISHSDSFSRCKCRFRDPRDVQPTRNTRNKPALFVARKYSRGCYVSCIASGDVKSSTFEVILVRSEKIKL